MKAKVGFLDGAFFPAQLGLFSDEQKGARYTIIPPHTPPTSSHTVI